MYSSVTDSTKMQWWKEAKFGMFIHWGVYAVPAGVYDGKDIPGIGEWIMHNAKIPSTIYKRYANNFNPVRYDPTAWVKMAKDAGVKYIVITSKHHDGFALFDSGVTDWDVVDATPYGKDLLKPLVEACKKSGIKIGFYYSQAQDWNHPGGAAMGGHWDTAQDGDMDAYLDTIAVPQVKEILSNYGKIDILWWDTPEGMTTRRAEKFLPLLKEHPDLITNNRLGGGFKGDTETPEQFVPATGFPGRNWETCMTMNDTWGYKSTDSNWKSAKTLIRSLVDAVSKGGNLLLNVGPTSLGEIPQASIDRMAAIGKWMSVNKESIYGTTASPFPFLSWGRATRNGQKLYLHVFDYPLTADLHVPIANKITRAYLLSNPASLLPVKRGPQVSVIHLPTKAVDTSNTVVVLEFEGEPLVKSIPSARKNIIVSSQKSTDEGGKNLLDGDRRTIWRAGEGQHKATIEIDLQKATSISTILIDEPWHPWDNIEQKLVLQYKMKNKWETAAAFVSGGTGLVKRFKPVTAQWFRLQIENSRSVPALSEIQLFGPDF